MRRYLRKKKRAFHAAAPAVAFQRTATVQLPVPQRKDQNVREPKRACRTQQGPWRFTVSRQPLNQEDQGSDQGHRDRAVGDECESPAYVVLASTIGLYDRNQQNQDDRQQKPTGA